MMYVRMYVCINDTINFTIDVRDRMPQNVFKNASQFSKESTFQDSSSKMQLLTNQ